MSDTERLYPSQAVTEAEIYAAKIVEEELQREGITTESYEWRIIITRTADVLAAHREEVRDVYTRSKDFLADWILRMSGIKDLEAFRKMKRIGFTGNIADDMRKMERR